MYPRASSVDVGLCEDVSAPTGAGARLGVLPAGSQHPGGVQQLWGSLNLPSFLLDTKGWFGWILHSIFRSHSEAGKLGGLRTLLESP